MGFVWFTLGSVLVAATAVLLAASFRLRTLPAFLLAAYLLANAELVAVAEILSPFHAVTRSGYLAAGAIAAAVAIAVWWARGRPLPPLGGLRHVRELGAHPVLVILAVVVSLGLLYELVVGVTTPPNNWDSLWHHLVRVAAWRQYHAVAPIPNATAPLGINADPPDAEIAILFSVVLIGRDTLATMPQFLAECSLLVSVFGIARRVGFARAPSAFAALLTGTLSEIALQSVTTQNDLVVGALVAAAAFFVLGSSRIDIVLAGLAVGLALGTKLTTLLVLPALALLAFAAGGVRHTVKVAAWSALALAAFGGFIYFRSSGDVSTLAGTATSASPGTSSLRAQPSLLGTVSTAARVLYGFLDFSGFRPLFMSTTAMLVLLFSVPLAAIVVARRWTASIVLAAAVPVIGFLLSRAGHGLFALFHIPLNPPKATGDDTFTFRVQQYASENVSYFGPVGMLLLWPLSIWVLAKWFVGEIDRRDRRAGRGPPDLPHCVRGDPEVGRVCRPLLHLGRGAADALGGAPLRQASVCACSGHCRRRLARRRPRVRRGEADRSGRNAADLVHVALGRTHARAARHGTRPRSSRGSGASERSCRPRPASDRLELSVLRVGAGAERHVSQVGPPAQERRRRSPLMAHSACAALLALADHQGGAGRGTQLHHADSSDT